MSKKIFILFIILNLCFCITVFGTSDTESDEAGTENSSNDVYSTSYSSSENETEEADEEETEIISSYTTISSIPEANLGLNNILNIILITFGILMILLGIAILIRLKN